MPQPKPSNQPKASWTGPDSVTHEGVLLQQAGAFDIIDCACCRFKHAIPIPTPEDLTHVYAHEYYTQEKPLYIERYLEDKAWWDSVYAERYEFLERHVPAGSRNILDVGSGPGLFLLVGQERGWQVTGVEPSQRAAEHSQKVLGLDVRNIFLTPESASSLGSFTVVNMGEVLEHLPNPRGMLDVAHSLLNPQGLLTLIVPNDFNPFQAILHEHMGFEPWWVAPPHHLNYFNRESLSGLVKSAGFDVLHIESTFPIDMFLLMGQNYVGNDALGRQVHSYRKQFDLAIQQAGASELKRRLYQAMSDLGIGREIVLFARKQ